MDHRKDTLQKPKIELVLKCDSVGSAEAVSLAISKIPLSGIELSIIHSGVGSVSKSDVLLAETGSRLIIGFQAAVLPGMDKITREHNVEVRLYNVIYDLTADLQTIASSLKPPDSPEQIIGSAKVIATFKSSRRGIILGCEVSDGHLAVGQHFRIISVMGPVYAGIIESMHVGENTADKAVRGQQVGIKIREFDKAKIGDLVESFRPLRQEARPWQPSGKIIRK